MGTKFAVMFVSPLALSYFSTEPKYDLDRARKIIQVLSLGPAAPEKVGRLGMALGSYPDAFGLGAYEDGFVLADRRLYGLVTSPKHVLRDLILSSFPSSDILILELHSGNNVLTIPDLINRLGTTTGPIRAETSGVKS